MSELTDAEARIAEQHIAYEGTVELAKWIDTSSHGFKITLNLADRSELDPFDGVMAMRKNRGGQRYQAIIAPIVTEIDHGTHPDWDRSSAQEWQFAGRGWSESAGAHIAMGIADPDTIQFWRNANTGDQSDEGGQRYGIMLLELDEDEQIINQEKRARVVPNHEKPGGPKSKRVARLLTDIDFQRWLGQSIYQRYDNPMHFDDPKAVDQLIKGTCNIKSKREFDHDAVAWQRFEEQFMRPFVQYLRQEYGR